MENFLGFGGSGEGDQEQGKVLLCATGVWWSLV
jgi:hypothetical protein